MRLRLIERLLKAGSMIIKGAVNPKPSSNEVLSYRSRDELLVPGPPLNRSKPPKLELMGP